MQRGDIFIEEQTRLERERFVCLVRSLPTRERKKRKRWGRRVGCHVVTLIRRLPTGVYIHPKNEADEMNLHLETLVTDALRDAPKSLNDFPLLLFLLFPHSPFSLVRVQLRGWKWTYSPYVKIEKKRRIQARVGVHTPDKKNGSSTGRETKLQKRRCRGRIAKHEGEERKGRRRKKTSSWRSSYQRAKRKERKKEQKLKERKDSLDEE